MADGMDVKVEANCTWKRSGGCSLEKAIQTEITHEDLFYKPALDDILREDRAVLLAPNSVSADTGNVCELNLKLMPRYKISSLHCLCSAPKVELFMGSQMEYTEMVYGSLVEDDDNSGENRATMDITENEEVRSYRYDIEVMKSGIVELTLKFPTMSKEICIFGLLLLVGPNPCGATTLLPRNAGVNLENVQEILSSSKQKLSPSAEKCKLFIEACNKSKLTSDPSLLEHMKHMMNSQMSHAPEHNSAASALEKTQIESYIDARLSELENRITARLDALEAQQTQKLDEILKRLQTP